MKPLDTDADPRVLGPFELLAILGQGGMGRAYLARRIPLESLSPEMEAAYYLADRDPLREDGLVVVKVISPEFLAGDSSPGEADKRARFAREISAVRAVVSDRVPSLLGGDPDAAQPWLAVDYIHGPNLHAMIKQAGPLPIGPYAALGLALVEALRAIHGADLLHRDLKPANVVLGPTGPVVLDFGLAVLAERRTSQALTRTGVGFGSPGYLPLEQAQDLKRVSHPADVYSLGATLFFAASGRPPYPVSPLPVPPVWDGVDSAFVPLLAQILVQYPEQRPSLDDVEQSLLVMLIQHGLTPQEAQAQLREAVETAGLAPELPPQALAGQADPDVREAAQRAVDNGAAPDSPWAEGADLFEELFGPQEAEAEARAPHEPRPPAAPAAPQPAAEPHAPATAAPTGQPVAVPPPAAYTPTVVDPAARPPAVDYATSYPLAPPQPVAAPAAGTPAPAPSQTAPPAARKAAERLRKAYAHSRRL